MAGEHFRVERLVEFFKCPPGRKDRKFELGFWQHKIVSDGNICEQKNKNISNTTFKLAFP